MPRIIGGIWGILFLLLVCVFPADSQDEKNPLVQELFAKSGLDQLIERLPMIVQQGLHQAFAQDENLKKLPAQTLEEIMDAAASAYESQKLRNIMLRSFAGKMDDAEIRSVIQWLDSPTGVKCTDLEKQSLTAEAFQELSRFAEEIQKKPPRPERLKLIGELDRATKATATSVEIFINSNLAVATAVTLSLPQENSTLLSEFKKKLETGKAAIENALQEQTHPENMFPKAENDEPMLHGALHLKRFTPQQPFQIALHNLTNSLCRMMAEKLHHPCGWLQVIPHPVKRL